MNTFYFSDNHIYFNLTDVDSGTIGLSAYAARELGEIVFIDISVMPGDRIRAGDEVAVIESIKSVIPIESPVNGTILEINNSKTGIKALNSSPEGEGWIVKIKIDSAEQLKKLKPENDYRNMTDKL